LWKGQYLINKLFVSCITIKSLKKMLPSNAKETFDASMSLRIGFNVLNQRAIHVF